MIVSTKIRKWWGVIMLFIIPSAFSDTIDYGNLTVSSSATSLTIGPATTVNIFNSGWAQISGGELVVNGNLNGMTTSITGGRVSGTGTITMWGMVSNEGGTLMPGSTSNVGQLTISGTYVQSSGGTLLIPISITGSSLLQVNGVANLGGNLAGTLLNGFIPTPGASYTILSATSITGQFSNQAFVTPTLYLNPVYNPANVTVTVTRNYTSNPSLRAILSPNEFTIGTILNNVNNQLSMVNPDFNTVLSAIDNLQTNQAVAAAYQSLEPLSNDILLNLAVSDATFKTQLLDERVGNWRNQSASTGLNLLVAGNGYEGQSQEQLENENYPLQGNTLVLAADHALSNHHSLGLLAETNQSTVNIQSSNILDRSILLAPYFMYNSNNWYADALAGFGNNDFHLNRSIAFGSINREAKSSFSANEYLGYFNLGRDYFYNQWRYGPQVSLQYVQLDLPGYQESGAQSLNLAVNNQNVESLRVGFGGHIFYQTAVKNVKMTPTLSVTLFHETLNSPANMNISFLGTPNTSGQLIMDGGIRNFALFDAGIELLGNSPWHVNLNYTAQVNSSSQVINAVSALGTYSFA